MCTIVNNLINLGPIKQYQIIHMGNDCISAEQQKPIQVIREKIQDSKTQQELINDVKQSLNINNEAISKFYQVTKDQISIKDFIIEKVIGKGSYGVVYKVTQKKTGEPYALKVVEKRILANKKQKIQSLVERLILQAVDHPFIIKLFYAFQNSKYFYLIFELITGPELFQVIRTMPQMPYNQIKLYAAEILLALQYLHSKSIIYRDLKPENIMIDSEGHLKLIDFGISKVLGQLQKTFTLCGTLVYMAPEILNGKGYTKTSDWFSFGVLLFTMFEGRAPYSDYNIIDLYSIKSKVKPQLNANVSKQVKSFLEGLLCLKPQKRLGYNGVNQIKNHEFFKGVDFTQVLNKQIKPQIVLNIRTRGESIVNQFQRRQIYQSQSNSKYRKSVIDDIQGYGMARKNLVSVQKKNEPLQIIKDLNSHQQGKQSMVKKSQQ